MKAIVDLLKKIFRPEIEWFLSRRKKTEKVEGVVAVENVPENNAAVPPKKNGNMDIIARLDAETRKEYARQVKEREVAEKKRQAEEEARKRDERLRASLKERRFSYFEFICPKYYKPTVEQAERLRSNKMFAFSLLGQEDLHCEGCPLYKKGPDNFCRMGNFDEFVNFVKGNEEQR